MSGIDRKRSRQCQERVKRNRLTKNNSTFFSPTMEEFGEEFFLPSLSVVMVKKHIGVL